MSQIKAKIYFLWITAVMLLAMTAGCGSPNSQSVFDTDTGEHPGSWLVSGHKTAYLADQTACDGCHGIDSGGVSGIACSSCHINASSAVAADCTSCHSKPPSGAVYPNIEGAHTEHINALTSSNVANTCSPCHNGAGSGTVNHYSGAVDVLYLSTYNAKSGTASYNSGAYTCSKISCHGGQTTPNWRTGAISVNDDCTSCHAYGTAEYNSFNSGRHDYHVNTLAYDCTTCHDTAPAKLGAIHFAGLDTSALSGHASTTIIAGINYNGTACGAYCHAGRDWN